MIRYAVTIRPCHSHQLACHLRQVPPHRDPDHRLGQEQEAGDDGHGQRVPAPPVDRPVASRADRVHRRADDRDDGDQALRRGRLTGRAAQWREARDRPREPQRHRDQDRDAQKRPSADQDRGDPGTDVDERRAEGEHGAHEQAHGNGDLESRVLLGEEDLGRPDGMEAQEAAGRHERQREQKDAGIAAPVRGLARRVPEEERRCAHDSEDHEVERVVLDVRIEPRAEEKGGEPDQRQRGGDEPAGDDSSPRCRSAPSDMPCGRSPRLSSRVSTVSISQFRR